jgi:hypothetical protein
MAVEKVFIAPEFIGLEGRERIVTRRALRPSAPVAGWTLWTPFAAMITFVVAASEALDEVHRMRRQAERRYPHISFDT